MTEEQRSQAGCIAARMQRGLSPRAARDGFTLFRPSESAGTEAVRFELRPVVFNLPERGDHRECDLFVVVRGRLSFRREDFRDRKALLTHDFGSEVGYFRRAGDSLTHVYGAHYDLATNELGHPAFHAQLGSFADFADHVREQFGVSGQVVDPMKGLIRTVRVPAAQMDVFSLFVQICADHLLSKKSNLEEKKAFNALLEKGAFWKGAAFQMVRLGTEEARDCYRARHWYPRMG